MAITRSLWAWLLIAVLLCATFAHAADKLVSADNDDFEDEEFESKPRPGVPLEVNKPASQALQQDDKFFYDADEFEGFEEVKKPKVEEEVEAAPQEAEKEQVPFTPRPKFGAMEMFYISFIVVLLGNYFVGRRRNEKIATSWGTTYQNLFNQNFAKFGDAERFIITKESANTFSVTANAGRVRAYGAQFTLTLEKRHDLTSYLTAIFNPQRDTLTVDVAMYPSQPFCFGIAKKKEEKQLLKNYKEVGDFGVVSKTPVRLANNYVTYTDSSEIVEDIFTREVVEILANNEALFSSVGYQYRSTTYLQYKTILRIVYRLPPPEDMKKLQDLMRLVFLLIDNFSNVQLTKGTLAKNASARKKVRDAEKEKTPHELRQEMAQKKKQERLAAERAAYDKMSPEQQRRYDEKEEKRKLKAKQQKVKVVYS